jgi:hypothetical protein
MTLLKPIDDTALDGGFPLGEAGGRLFFQDCAAEYSHLLGVHYKSMNLTSLQQNTRGDSGDSSDASATTHLRIFFPILNLVVPRQSSRPLPGRVSCLALHPHLMQLAVSYFSGTRTTVRLYDVVSERSLSPDLTHGFMTGAQVMRWKPCSKGTLVVGCQGGVLVWHVADVWNSRALFYPCGGQVTSIAFGGEDFCLLAAGGDDFQVVVHDLSKSPAESERVVKRFLDGPTTSLQFSFASTMLLQGCRNSSVLKVWDMHSDSSVSNFATEKPVLQISPVGEDLSWDVFAVSFERTEGIAVIRVLPREVVVLAKISTSNDSAGGSVRWLATSSRRLFLVTESRKALVFHVELNKFAFTARFVGSFGVSEGALITSSSECFPNGTLLAVAADGIVQFIPCYHMK